MRLLQVLVWWRLVRLIDAGLVQEGPGLLWRSGDVGVGGEARVVRGARVEFVDSGSAQDLSVSLSSFRYLQAVSTCRFRFCF